MTPPPPAPSRRVLLKGAATTSAAAAADRCASSTSQPPRRRPTRALRLRRGQRRPDRDAVVIWTRVTPPPRPSDPVATPGSGLGAPAQVRWEVALTRDFSRVVAPRRRPHHPGQRPHGQGRRHRPQPYTRYWYRFRAAGRPARSDAPRPHPTSRAAPTRCALRWSRAATTRAATSRPTARIGKRDDLDFVLHVGDYIYEYGNGADRYGPDELAGTRDGQPADRDHRPAGLPAAPRHPQGRPRPAAGARAAPVHHHLRRPRGRQQRLGGRRGEPHTRHRGRLPAPRRAAYQAYLEWMPFRLPDQRREPTTASGSSSGSPSAPSPTCPCSRRGRTAAGRSTSRGFTTTGGGFIPTGAPAVDAALADPGRHLPEPEQLTWLKDGLAERRALAPGRQPGDPGADPLPGRGPRRPGEPAAAQLRPVGRLPGRPGCAARAPAGQPADAGDPVVLTGDIHSSWAIDLPATCPRRDGAPDAVRSGRGVRLPVRHQ